MCFRHGMSFPSNMRKGDTTADIALVDVALLRSNRESPLSNQKLAQYNKPVFRNDYLLVFGWHFAASMTFPSMVPQASAYHSMRGPD